MGTPGGANTQILTEYDPEEFQHDFDIWGHFWSKLVYLSPHGSHLCGSPNCYAFDVEDITSGFNLYVFFFVQLLLCVI